MVEAGLNLNPAKIAGKLPNEKFSINISELKNEHLLQADWSYDAANGAADGYTHYENDE